MGMVKSYGIVRCHKCNEDLTGKAQYIDPALGICFCGNCNASYD